MLLLSPSSRDHNLGSMNNGIAANTGSAKRLNVGRAASWQNSHTMVSAIVLLAHPLFLKDLKNHPQHSVLATTSSVSNNTDSKLWHLAIVLIIG